jgi:GNAT superfamily N-acetyltransferase|tara:strand:+ start:5819 stop:6265 length:447 start_codon:yes stop_codon:yes gene_type:complete
MIFEVKTDSELLELRDVLQNFYEILPYEKDLNGFKKNWILSWKELIRSKKGKIFALEDERKITGALGFLIGPALEDGVLCCTEAFWYVDEKHRGAGLKLLNKFESYSKSIGCKRIGMVHLENSMPDKLKKLYTRKKYKHIESMYLKEL